MKTIQENSSKTAITAYSKNYMNSIIAQAFKGSIENGTFWLITCGAESKTLKELFGCNGTTITVKTKKRAIEILKKCVENYKNKRALWIKDSF